MNEEKISQKDNFKLARTICWILSIFTIATIIIGLFTKNPFTIIIGIVPAAVYEVIRTEGYYTKIASAAIAILVVLEIFALKNVIHYNLATFFSSEQIYFSGYFLPLGDLIFVFPLIAVILSLILAWRTYGKYTKWLAILLLLSSISLLYLVNKESLFDLLRSQRYFF